MKRQKLKSISPLVGGDFFCRLFSDKLSSSLRLNPGKVIYRPSEQARVYKRSCLFFCVGLRPCLNPPWLNGGTPIFNRRARGQHKSAGQQ